MGSTISITVVSASIVAAIINLFGSSAHAQGVEFICDKEKPVDCAVISPPHNLTFLQNQFNNSLVSIKHSATSYYTGDTAKVAITIDVAESQIKDIEPVAYVTMGNKVCADSTRCELLTNETVRTRVCTFNNLTKSDNRIKIYFYGFSSNYLSTICFNTKPIIIRVKGPPSGVHLILQDKDICLGVVNITTNSTIDNDTVLEVKVYHMNGTNELIEEGTIPHDTMEYVFTANITTPRNGGSEYVFGVIPVNKAGSGPSSNISVMLPYITNNFTVSNVSVEIGANGSFIGIPHIQNPDTTCPSAGPALVEISSSCSSENLSYYISPTKEFNIIPPPELPLSHGQHNCSFSVVINHINEWFIDTCQDTFYTKDCNVWAEVDHIVVMCRFIESILANGLWITILDSEGKNVTNKLYSYEDYVNGYNITLGPFDPGNYTVLIHDNIKDRVLNISDTAVFTKDIVIHPKNITPTPVEPLPSQSCFGEYCRSNLLGHIIGPIIGSGSVLIILIVLLGIALYQKVKRGKRGDYEVPAPLSDGTLNQIAVPVEVSNPGSMNDESSMVTLPIVSHQGIDEESRKENNIDMSQSQRRTVNDATTTESLSPPTSASAPDKHITTFKNAEPEVGPSNPLDLSQSSPDINGETEKNCFEMNSQGKSTLPGILDGEKVAYTGISEKRLPHMKMEGGSLVEGSRDSQNDGIMPAPLPAGDDFHKSHVDVPTLPPTSEDKRPLTGGSKLPNQGGPSTLTSDTSKDQSDIPLL